MKIVIIIYFVVLPLSLFGQYRADSLITIPVDSTRSSFTLIEKKRGKAVSINVSLNMVMRGFNRFILEDEYAQINLQSMRNNINTLPVWDSDRFSTNLIGHPFHGSMYFNSARTNGFGFYQSSLVTAAGSLMWEYLMETKPPSHNDLWATTVSGTALGEILFRLSDLILDNRETGVERVGRELLAGVLTPTRFVTRLTTGEAWKVAQNRGNLVFAPPYRLELYLGETGTGLSDRDSGLWSTTLGADLNYGELYGISVGKPYEWFRATGEASIRNSRLYLTQFNTIGLLHHRELYQNEDSWLTAGLFQHFNYYDLKQASDEPNATPLYISEAAAIGPGIIVHKRKSNSEAQFGAHLSGIILGASASDHFKLGDRDYNFGSGFSLKIHGSFQFSRKLFFSLFAENYRLYSWKGVDDYDKLKNLTIDEIDFLNVQGDESNARLYLLGLKMRYSLSERINFLLRARHLTRNMMYTHFPEINNHFNEFFFGIGITV